MLEPGTVWKQTHSRLAEVNDGSWSRALASWAAERTTGKLQLQMIQGNVLFNFNQALFEARLRGMAATAQLPVAARALADCWSTAVMASQLLVLPGSFLGSPTPATTWSAVTSLVNPASVQLAATQLQMQLTRAAFVDEASQSVLPEALRSAFLMVKADVVGINSLPIPTPLLSPMSATA